MCGVTWGAGHGNALGGMGDGLCIWGAKRCISLLLLYIGDYLYFKWVLISRDADPRDDGENDAVDDQVQSTQISQY